MIRRTFLALTIALAASPALAQFDTLTLKPIVKAVREGDEDKLRASRLSWRSADGWLLWLASARLVSWLCSGGWRRGVCTCCSSERDC